MNPDRLKFLKALRPKLIAEEVPIVSETNAKLLHFLITARRATNILEIGTASAYSTIWMATATENFRGNVTTLEHSTPAAADARANLEAANVTNVELIFGWAQESLEKLQGNKYDFIFIDARKKHYHIFWELCKPMMTDDAIVVVDDVLKFPEKTAEFQAAIAAETDYEHVTLPIDSDDGTMLIQKKR